MTIQIREIKANQETFESLEKDLMDSSVPLVRKFNILFQLKALNTPESIKILQKAFAIPSALLRHEVAYVLGQMKNPLALPGLEVVLRDESMDLMTRHEAAEAMGAIGQPESIPILAEFTDSEHKVIKETCVLAIDSIKNYQKASISKFESIDPALPFQDIHSIEELTLILLDASKPLHIRYRAMFTLRDIGSLEAIEALAKGLSDESDLFRHEVCYVYGQMQDPRSIDVLEEVLRNDKECGMVRHEAAEAMGSIGGERVEGILREFVADKVDVVRESCMVALGMMDNTDFVVISQ